MSGTLIKVVKAKTTGEQGKPATEREGAARAIVEKLTLPALIGPAPSDARLNDIHDRLSKLEVAADRVEPPAPTHGPVSVLRAAITLAPVSGSGDPEIFRISVPGGQSVFSVWVESPTGPLGGFLSQVITSDAGSAVVAFINLLTEPKEVRVCLGIGQGN